jgi:caffeoyl-CoA O-methyltransferase
MRKLVYGVGAVMIAAMLVAFMWQDCSAQQGRSTRGGRREPGGEAAPTSKTEPEQKILGVLDDMYRNQRRGMMNVPPEDGRLLRLLTEAVGAKHVVEIGTSNGYSGLWICLALRTTGGKLTTHEINRDRAALARENFKRAGVDDLVTLVEGDAHQEVTKLNEPIDILFLDADKEGYIDYLNKLLPLIRPGGLILAHNTSSSAGAMRDYLEAITTSPDLETLFWHKDAAGVGVTLKKR